MAELIIAGDDEEKMLGEALQRLRLPREAVLWEVRVEDADTLLPGARPQIQMHVRVRPEYLGEQAAVHLGRIFDILGIEARTNVDIKGDMVFVRVASPEAAAMLAGHDSSSLDALQYLVNRMVLRASREAPMVIIDVDDFRQRQFEKLERLADRAVAHARKTGNEIELDPMPPLERKYLHFYLRQFEGVKTFSRGEEPERCLVLIAD